MKLGVIFGSYIFKSEYLCGMCRNLLFFDVKIDDKLISCTVLKIKVFFMYVFLIIVFNRIVIFF